MPLTIIHVTPDLSSLATINTNVRCSRGCNKTFKSSAAMELHVQMIHDRCKREKKKKDEIYYYHCPEESCMYHQTYSSYSKYFKSHKYLKQHYLKVHAEKNHCCNTCSEKFSTQALLTAHQKSCGILLMCSCEFQFKSLEGLQTHLRRFPDHSMDPNTVIQLKTKNLKERTETLEQSSGKSHSIPLESSVRQPSHIVAAIALSELAGAILKQVSYIDVGVQVDLYTSKPQSKKLLPLLKSKETSTEEDSKRSIESQTRLTNNKKCKIIKISSTVNKQVKSSTKSIKPKSNTKKNSHIGVKEIILPTTKIFVENNKHCKKNNANNLSTQTSQMYNQFSENTLGTQTNQTYDIFPENTLGTQTNQTYDIFPENTLGTQTNQTYDIFPENSLGTQSNQISNKSFENNLGTQTNPINCLLPSNNLGTQTSQKCSEFSSCDFAKPFQLNLSDVPQGTNLPDEIDYSFDDCKNSDLLLDKSKYLSMFNYQNPSDNICHKEKKLKPLFDQSNFSSIETQTENDNISCPYDLYIGEDIEYMLGSKRSVGVGSCSDMYKIGLSSIETQTDINNLEGYKAPLLIEENYLDPMLVGRNVLPTNLDIERRRGPLLQIGSSSIETQTDRDIFLGANTGLDEDVVLTNNETQTEQDALFRSISTCISPVVFQDTYCCNSQTQTYEEFSDIEKYLCTSIYTQTADTAESELFPELNVVDMQTQTGFEEQPLLVHSHTQTSYG